MKKIFLSVMVLLVLLSFGDFNISAESYNYNQYGKAVPSQSGYTAERAVYGYNLGISEFESPSDIFLYDDVFYLTDSGNNRIVCINKSLDRVVKIYDKFTMPDKSETVLKNPTGVYVDSERIYIADSENSRILVSDYDSDVILEIKKPDDVIYNYNTFNPQKVIADKAGNIYAVLNNITSGAVMFDSKGNFMGFYGANRTDEPSDIVFESIKDIFRSDEKKLRQKRNVPSGISNFDIDDGNFIYTCTQSDSQHGDTIKKINSAGQNLFMYNTNIFGDYPDLYSAQEKNMFCDIDVSENGYINCLDFRYGRIFTYDKDCNLMFVSGEKSHQLGGFERVSALESDENNLYVLDSMKASITVFEKTDFGRLVSSAENLYNSGSYSESLELWNKVLEYDSGYIQAYKGIASVLLIQQNYSDSMKYAEKARITDIYNKAFEGWREDFLSRFFGFVIIFIVLIFALLYRISKIKIKSSLRNSVIILIFFLIASVADGRLYGIQFSDDNIQVFNIVPYILESVGLFFLWCISERASEVFLDGCGTFRNIFIGTSEAVIPYIAQLYINTMLSHILIRDEYIFMEIIKITGIIWTAILLFKSVREINRYSFRETVIAVIMIVFGIAVIFFLGVLMLSLFQQIYVFIASVVTEISYRIRS